CKSKLSVLFVQNFLASREIIKFNNMYNQIRQVVIVVAEFGITHTVIRTQECFSAGMMVYVVKRTSNAFRLLRLSYHVCNSKINCLS
ncbi:29699_t:CDS:1, partial [Racocetra persica]